MQCHVCAQCRRLSKWKFAYGDNGLGTLRKGRRYFYNCGDELQRKFSSIESIFLQSHFNMFSCGSFNKKLFFFNTKALHAYPYPCCQIRYDHQLSINYTAINFSQYFCAFFYCNNYDITVIV